MLGTSVIGGYCGARLTRRLSPRIAPGCVVGLTATVTLACFMRLL
jgi:hypothetical protein